MNTLKKLEQELILDWQSLQSVESALTKRIALKAYYIKYELYRKARNWQLLLEEAAVIPVTSV